MAYHVNPDTGKIAVCKAKVQCKFGPTARHYDTNEQALVAVVQTGMMQERLALYKRLADSSGNASQQAYVEQVLEDADELVIEEEKPSPADLLEQDAPHAEEPAPATLPVPNLTFKPVAKPAPASTFDDALNGLMDDDEY